MDRQFREQRDLLDSVKGVGPVTILTMTAALPELWVDSSAARSASWWAWRGWPTSPAAAGASGASGAARAEVRAVLYMATALAMRHNPMIRHVYERWLAAGKPKKVAIVACMRKLPTILNAMLRDATAWSATRHISPGRTA
jgi:transposase